MEKQKKYIVELDNNANAIVTSSRSTYCMKCGKKLDENSLDRFCDSECRREYFAEIRKDIDSLEI
jgi:hypothetical protein